MRDKYYLATLGGAVSTVLLAGMAMVMPNAFASQATSSTATVTVSATCSLTGTVKEEHSITMNNGEYEDGIGKTELKAFCNDPNGFSIYAVGYTGDTRGQTMLHNSAIGAKYDIPTGVSGSDSEWSMMVTPKTTGTTSDNGFNAYSEIPAQYTRVAYNSSTTDPTVGSTLETTYAVRVSQTQPAGTYVGQVKYILVHPSGNTPSEMPTMQTVASWGETLLLNEEVTAVDTRDNNTYTVARLCVERDTNTGSCTSSQLWMTQNLNFAPSSATTYTHADTDLGWSTNDASATWKPRSDTMGSPAYITNFASGSPADSLSGWTNDNNKPHYAEGKYYDATNGGFTNDEIIAYNGVEYVGSAACIAAGHTASQCDHYKVGNYYNWPASIANNDASSITAQYTVAPDSICPAGWRLPNGITNNGSTNVQSEFNALLIANGVTETSITETSTVGGGTNAGYTSNGFSLINSAPLYFVRSGYVRITTLYEFTSYGRYWSSTAVSSSDAYDLYYHSGAVYPAYRRDRYNGRSVRCVAR